MAAPNRLEVLQVACYQSVSQPCDSNLRKGQVARIGKNDVERPHCDLFARELYEINQRIDIGCAKPKEGTLEHFTVFQQNPVIVQQGNGLGNDGIYDASRSAVRID